MPRTSSPRGTDGQPPRPLRRPPATACHVISPEGWLGTLDAVEADESGEPVQLRLRSGLFVRRITFLPAGFLVATVPHRRRVYVDWTGDRDRRRR